MNRFFKIVVDTVGAHGGWVNKFEGDAAPCVFGAPIPDDGCASGALVAARTLRSRLRAELPEADAGVSAGPVVAGNVGAEHRFEYTVIGDPVNEAARLGAGEAPRRAAARLRGGARASRRARGRALATRRLGHPALAPSRPG